MPSRSRRRSTRCSGYSRWRELVRGEGVGSTEALRLAQDLARTLDLLLVEEVDPRRLREPGRTDDLRALAGFARPVADDH